MARALVAGAGLACAGMVCAGVVACSDAGPIARSDSPSADWPHHGGDLGESHYSPLTEIDRDNVHALEVAWEHRSGDAFDGSGATTLTALQVTPLVVNETLYYCTPFMRVFALDPETGAERWSFDPQLKAKQTGGPYPLTCRGVSYWEAASAPPGAKCDKRIFLGTKDSELIALDADTGEPCADFGAGGRLGLREGLGSAEVWEYYPTSPPLILGDTLVIGALVADNVRVDVPSGVVRAFDVRTGRLLWAWDPVPPGWAMHPDPATGRIYEQGTPNVWALITGDAERGLVFVPTGNPSPDAFGGQRDGVDHYGSSTVALDARTGRVRWHFQTVHHDIWDYDTAAPPQLFQIPGVGGGAAGVLQATKMGTVFLLDRETGRPMYPVEERPVPQAGAVPEETLSPTQPFPTHVPPLHETRISPADVFGFTPFDRKACADTVAALRYDGIFTPPGLDPAILFPHTSGGINWAGAAIDPERGLMIVNQTHVALMMQLVPRAEADALEPGAIVYPEEFYPMRGTPYALKRAPVLSPLGAPCNAPPWGTLTAVDLRSGEIAWRIPFGSTRELAPFPMWLDMGVPNFGGGIATASGLYFIGATTDKAFRAFDSRTGETLWETRLPYMGVTLPMTYRLPGGRQFVVVGAGGNPLGEMGDALVAFALPAGGDGDADR